MLLWWCWWCFHELLDAVEEVVVGCAAAWFFTLLELCAAVLEDEAVLDAALWDLCVVELADEAVLLPEAESSLLDDLVFLFLQVLSTERRGNM